MKTAVVALTPGGLRTARRICRLLARPFLFCPSPLRVQVEGAPAAAAPHCREGKKGGCRLAFFPAEGLRPFIAGIFPYFDLLVLVMAAGIAVRLLAPCLGDKKTDPAVIVVDDTGRFVLSLLGGHQRGANDLAEQIAAGLRATAVITTATDRRRLLAFDQLAQRRGWVLEHGEDLKRISAAQLRGEKICVLAPFPPISSSFPGEVVELPAGCLLLEETAALFLPPECRGLVFCSNKRTLPPPPPGLPYIVIRPRTLVAGVGCRRGVPGDAVIAAVREALLQAGRVQEGLQALASIELKGEEKGLHEAARFFRVPLRLYSQEEIKEVEGLFAASAFVRRHTGVSAVAEPCAYLGSGGGTLLLPKRGAFGITVALAEEALLFCSREGPPPAAAPAKG